MLNTIVEENKKFHSKHIILADELTHMFDYDIENFKFIGDYCNLKIHNDNKIKNKRLIYFNNNLKKLLEDNSIDENVVFLTLEKSCTYQLLIKNIDADTKLNLDLDVNFSEPEVLTGTSDVSTDVDEYYTMTFVGDLLYEIITILKIED